MTFIEGNPGDGKAGPAARVLGRDVRCKTATGGFARAHRLAAIVANETVAEVPTTGSCNKIVANSVDTKVRHGAIAAITAGQQPSRKYSDGAELVGIRAGEGVRHGAAETEANGEAQLLVDANTVFDIRDDRVDECYVSAARVTPSIVVALRRNEDGRVTSQPLQAVVVPSALLDKSPGIDVSHGVAEGVQPKDQAISTARIIIVRKSDDELTAVDGMCATCQAGRRAAPR